MKWFLKLAFISLVSFHSSAGLAAAIVISTTPKGTEYGLLGTGTKKPLALIFTTNIHESLTDQYTMLGGDLLKAGFLVASLDVPCHGKDVKRKEVASLECWRARIEKGDGALFEKFSKRVSDVVADLVAKGRVDPRFVFAIGVSRGGYVALYAAARSPNIQYVVALSPVTDLQKLSEFAGLKVNQELFGFHLHYMELAQKHIFLQIGNDDDRVGTSDAIRLGQGVVASNKDRFVDISMHVMPFKGHGTAKDDLALNWILRQVKQPSLTAGRIGSAP